MTWPYVPSYHDAGRARGPRSAFVVHMAEGGGTVGFLSRANARGVSVHFVIEYSGRTVRMLPLDHMHTSINTSDIRLSDDPDGFYGHTAARGVLGSWADTRETLGPNHASIAVELEGFAADGPNAKQWASLSLLYRDMATAFPGIRSLGHRDFTTRKACPGKHIDWQSIGGHGPAGTGGDDMIPTALDGPFTVRIPAGTERFTQPDGSAAGGAFTSATVLPGYFKTDERPDTGYVAVPVTPGGADRQLMFVRHRDVTVEIPVDPDCDAAIAADRAKAFVAWKP